MDNAPAATGAQSSSARENFRILVAETLRAGAFIHLADETLDKLEGTLDQLPSDVSPLAFKSGGYAALTRIQQQLNTARAELEALHDAAVRVGQLEGELLPIAEIFKRPPQVHPEHQQLVDALLERAEGGA